METKTLKFSGDSDDNFHIYGTAERPMDYIGAFDKKVILKIMCGDNGVIVVGEYAPQGTKAASWNFGVSHLDDDIGFPTHWRISISESECSYSPELEIEMPIEDAITIEDMSIIVD